MAPPRWSTLDGVGLSKKHDAPHNIQPATLRGISWIGLRRRRVLLPLAALLVIYLFVKNIPTDVAPVGQRTNSMYGSLAPGHVLASAPDLWGGGSGKSHGTKQQYEGSVQLPNLVSSLRPHLFTVNNNNVLFAFPELYSASNLLPFACQMAQNNRSTVHIALLGRQDVAVQDILKFNGIKADDCPVFWHDARPDHPLESSIDRLAASIRAGFGHCCAALHPQLAFVDEAVEKDVVLGKILREVAGGTGVSLATLPRNVFQAVPWMSTLDSTSLHKMKEIEIEIVIQANDNSAGSLFRLLHSLHTAKYDGLFYPRLTIELPAQIDPFLKNFLEEFRWPPGSSPVESQLSLRHRISTKNLDTVGASLHTLESFYPRAATSHVLLLTPDAEVSPAYLHYLIFTLLEYKYGQDFDDMGDSIFGISLETPDKLLNDKPLQLERAPSEHERLLMWQAPNSNAVLILGDRWLELRTFLAHRLARDPALKTRAKDGQSVSKNYPSWLAEALDLMQARGQYTIYPAFASEDSGARLVTLHREMHQPPEEYAKAMKEDNAVLSFKTDEILHKEVLTDLTKHSEVQDINAPVSESAALQKLLFPKSRGSMQNLPHLRDMPMFSYTGKATDYDQSLSMAEKFAEEFSQQRGGCVSLDSRGNTKIGSVEYLFCTDG